ncbi:MAG: class II aldolase/adducin family protein [Beijerinckiaceae bacterium]|nr:class II aldolase/adducin family protein [Beijerinckiaceae bacterium]
MTAEEAKQKLIDAGIVLEAQGLGDFTRGHVTIRDPNDSGKFFMKPHSFGLDEMTMDNIVTCDLEGEKLGGSGPRHSEVYIHSEIFKVRPDVMSVIHAHPTHALALSATGRPLRAFSQGGAVFADGLGNYSDTIDLIRTKEMGAGVASSLGPYKGTMLKNHGVAIVGRTLEECVILTLMLENACQIQLLAEAAGETAPEFPRDDIMKLHDKISRPEQHTINFDYMVRKSRRQLGL